MTRRTDFEAIFHNVAAPRLLNLRMRRQVLKRKHVVCGKPHHRRRIECAGKVARGHNRLVQRFRSLVIRHQDQRRRLLRQRLYKERQIQRTRRKRQPRDAAPRGYSARTGSRASLQVTPNPIERI